MKKGHYKKPTDSPVSSPISSPAPHIPHITRDRVKMHCLMYAAARADRWVLHGARALNSYLPVEFQLETQDFDWLVHESESLEDLIAYLQQKTMATIETVGTKHSATVSLSVFKVRILDIMFVKTLPKDTKWMEVRSSHRMMVDSLSPILLPVEHTFNIKVCSFSHLVNVMQSCIHDKSDPFNEWRRVRDAKTMRKIIYCQSLGYQPQYPAWIPVSLLDHSIGISITGLVPPAAATTMPKSRLVDSETQTDKEEEEVICCIPEVFVETQDFGVQVEVDVEVKEKNIPAKPETACMDVQTDPMDVCSKEVQTDPVMDIQKVVSSSLGRGMSVMMDSFSKKWMQQISVLESKVASLKDKHRLLKTRINQLMSCCKYMYHGWRTDISFHKLYHEKMQRKFNKYRHSVNLLKMLTANLLESKSTGFRQWSLVNWAIFQDSFLRHLEWFACEGVPGMVETQLCVHDVPSWWKGLPEVFPFVSSTVSYALYYFFHTNTVTRQSDEMYDAMCMTSDKVSIHQLKLQNSYITRQFLNFGYDTLESKKHGWYISNMPSNLNNVDVVYDNSKIKMEAMVAMIVSSVLHHQINNDATDRKLLLTLQRCLQKFDSEFQLELDDNTYPSLITKKIHWQRPTPYYRHRTAVVQEENLTDSFVKNLCGTRKRSRYFMVKRKKLKSKK